MMANRTFAASKLIHTILLAATLSLVLSTASIADEIKGDGGKVRLLYNEPGTNSFPPFVMKKFALDKKYGFELVPIAASTSQAGRQCTAGRRRRRRHSGLDHAGAHADRRRQAHWHRAVSDLGEHGRGPHRLALSESRRSQGQEDRHLQPQQSRLGRHAHPSAAPLQGRSGKRNDAARRRRAAVARPDGSRPARRGSDVQLADAGHGRLGQVPRTRHHPQPSSRIWICPTPHS